MLLYSVCVHIRVVDIEKERERKYKEFILLATKYKSSLGISLISLKRLTPLSVEGKHCVKHE